MTGYRSPGYVFTGDSTYTVADLCNNKRTLFDFLDSHGRLKVDLANRSDNLDSLLYTVTVRAKHNSTRHVRCAVRCERDGKRTSYRYVDKLNPVRLTVDGHPNEIVFRFFNEGSYTGYLHVEVEVRSMTLVERAGRLLEVFT